jgi:hypothetical protein
MGQNIGLGLLVIGGAVTLISLFADIIGLSDDPGFQVGPRQWAGILIGVVLAVVGYAVYRRSQRT